MENNKGVIYCYTNKLNGKCYVGQTIHPEKRRKDENIFNYFSIKCDMAHIIKKDCLYLWYQNNKRGIESLNIYNRSQRA